MRKMNERMYGMGREGGGIFVFFFFFLLAHYTLFFPELADTHVYHEA